MERAQLKDRQLNLLNTRATKAIWHFIVIMIKELTVLTSVNTFTRTGEERKDASERTGMRSFL